MLTASRPHPLDAPRLSMSWLRQLSVRSQLLLVMLTVAIASTLAVAYSTYLDSSRALRATIYDQLDSIRASRARQIRDYFRSLEADLSLLGETPDMAVAATELQSAYLNAVTGDGPSEGISGGVGTAVSRTGQTLGGAGDEPQVAIEGDEDAGNEDKVGEDGTAGDPKDQADQAEPTPAPLPAGLTDGEPSLEVATRLATFYRDDFLPGLDDITEGTPVVGDYLPTRSRAVKLQTAYLALNPHPERPELLRSLEEIVLAAEADRSGGAAPAAPAVSAENGEAAGDGEASPLPAWQWNLLAELGDYDKAHQRHHDYLRRIVEAEGYYDLFLIDPQTESIVYTVKKEVDFGTSLRTGPYQSSNLAEVVGRAKRAGERGAAFFVDFARYRPSRLAPSAFMAAPIVSGSKTVGIVAVQISVEDLDRVLTGNRQWADEGFGESGEVYLVGGDRLLRSNSRAFLEDPEAYLETQRDRGATEAEIAAIEKRRTTILSQTVATEAVDLAIAGEAGTRQIVDYRGEPVISSFAPLNIPDVDWVILAEKDVAEAMRPIRELQRWTLVLAAGILIGSA